MSRPAAPRWYESRKGWYVELGGKQILLAKGKAGKQEAFKKFNELMAGGVDPASRRDVTAHHLAELFLEWSSTRLEPITVAGYRRRLLSFLEEYGTARAADLRPLHVTRWLEKHPTWNDSTRFGYVTAVKRLFNWSVREGYLEVNPVKHAEKPQMGRRTLVLTAEQAERVIEHAGRLPRFQDLLIAFWESGCRPNELFKLTAAGVDLDRGTWRVVNKTRRKTREPTRTIQLTPRLLELSRRLVLEQPEGPIFRNTRGRPWTVNSVVQGLEEARTRLGYGPEVTAYAFRHRYVTDALVNGVPVATVAALVGHKGTAMVMRHYSHLEEQHDHLRTAANLVRPGAGASPAPGTTSPAPPDPSPAPPDRPDPSAPPSRP